MVTPILRKPDTDTDAADDGAEARMRRALGNLGTARQGHLEAPCRTTYQAKAGAGRHRFRQDGEVPVVRISMAEGGRGREHQPRVAAEVVGAGYEQGGDVRAQNSSDTTRQMQELTEQMRATQTRLGHAELALREAGREAQARQAEAASLRQTLDAAEATLAQVRAELAASERARVELERRREATQQPSPTTNERDGIATRRKVGRPLGSTNNRLRDQTSASQPPPVKWWAGD